MPEYQLLSPVPEAIESRLNRTCRSPAGEKTSYRSERESPDGKVKAWFEGRLLQCRNCHLKHQYMKNPSATDHRKGAGRHVSFMLAQQRKTHDTDWMKHKVDSDYGKRVYSNRMSVVEPVFGNITTNKSSL